MSSTNPVHSIRGGYATKQSEQILPTDGTDTNPLDNASDIFNNRNFNKIFAADPQKLSYEPQNSDFQR